MTLRETKGISILLSMRSV